MKEISVEIRKCKDLMYRTFLNEEIIATATLFKNWEDMHCIQLQPEMSKLKIFNFIE